MAGSIRFLSGEWQDRLVRIRYGQTVLIGRDPECAIRLSASNVSRLHARLSFDVDGLTITNTSAINSLTVNGAKQETVRLNQWDVVVIGSTAFRVDSIDEDSEIIRTRDTATIAAAGSDLAAQYHTLFECLLSIQGILSQDGERLVERSLETLFIALPVTRLCLFSITEGDRLVQGFTSTSSRPTTSHMSHTFARKVLAANKAILMETVPIIDAAEWGNTLKEQAVRSILGVPVRMRGRPIAVLLCDNLDHPGILREAHAQVLECVSRSLEYVFQRDELRQLERKQLRSDHEFLAGQRVQAQIFTKSPTGAFAPMRWVVHYQPALELGGDFYDFNETSNLMTWVIADVSGKGIPAALVVSMLKAFCKALYSQNLGAGRFLSALDALCREELPLHMFFTCAIVQVDGQGTLTSCNIGHPPGLIVHPDGVITDLPSQGGMLGNAQLGGCSDKVDEFRMVLTPGDRLVLYTDGLVEAADADGIQFGGVRLAAVLRDGCGDIGHILAQVNRAVTIHHGHDHLEDDLTVIVGEWVDKGAGDLRPSLS
ncbi:MAG: SpoIIE family protein phosphatase [Planctomycetes bacterium]|nr:SpoIIE family protein phosphatase [Planctomycetota bacterium]